MQSFPGEHLNYRETPTSRSCCCRLGEQIRRSIPFSSPCCYREPLFGGRSGYALCLHEHRKPHLGRARGEFPMATIEYGGFRRLQINNTLGRLTFPATGCLESLTAIGSLRGVLLLPHYLLRRLHIHQHKMGLSVLPRSFGYSKDHY